MPERELSFVEDQLKKAFCTPCVDFGFQSILTKGQGAFLNVIKPLDFVMGPLSRPA